MIQPPGSGKQASRLSGGDDKERKEGANRERSGMLQEGSGVVSLKSNGCRQRVLERLGSVKAQAGSDAGLGGPCAHTKCGSLPLRLRPFLASCAAVRAGAPPLPPACTPPAGSSASCCVTSMPCACREAALAVLLVMSATLRTPRSRRMWAATP